MKKFLLIALILGVSSLSYGWKNGPVCYPDKDLAFTFTIETWAGEAPGDILVSVEDDELAVVSVGASPKLDDAHQVVLRHKAGDPGITAVVLSNKFSERRFRYEFEFRKGLINCSGAIIEVR